MRVRILDIDGSIPSQRGLAAALADARAQRVDLRSEEQALRLWASRRSLRRLSGRLESMPEPAGTGPCVTFYGSGDFHHLATMLIASIKQPVTIIHFDNHPDWVRAPIRNNCGGWVNRALELPFVERIVTLGVCSDDLVLPQLKSGNLAALSSGRLEIHPWRAQPSRVWGRIGDGYGHRQVGSYLVWSCLADQDWLASVAALVMRLPTEAVWVTIDKDVLRPADAITNWDQGEMPLDALLTALPCIAASRKIVGVDICGEYSAPRFHHPVKHIAARWDHPTAVPPCVEATARNEKTNHALIQTLRGILT